LQRSYNHPPDIDPKDDAVERVCVEYYEKFGLSLTGFLMHYGDYVNEDRYLAAAHQPSTTLETYLPNAQTEHGAVSQLMKTLKSHHKLDLFVFSTRPKITSSEFLSIWILMIPICGLGNCATITCALSRNPTPYRFKWLWIWFANRFPIFDRKKSYSLMMRV
jgi:hypothetical protein